jgi:ABC-type branched-subunit amino acid transport system substrate-binding protein
MAMNNLATTSDLKAGMKSRVRKDEARATDKQQKEDRAERPKDAERHDAENYSNVEQPLDETLFGEYAAWDGVMADVPFVAVPASRELNVALLMPFHDAKGTPKGSFVDFYRGVLLAMEDLKAKGYTINLKVIDTKNSAERIYSYSAIGELDVDLIIGPAYRSEFLPLLRFAERKNIPVVSPLTNIDVSSPVLFNMPPADEFRGEPIKHLLDGSHTLVTIYASSNDYDYVKDVYKEAAGASNISLNFTFNRESFFYQRNADGSNGPSVDIESIMRDKAKKVFVVAASSDVDVDRILGTLSSTKMSVKGRGLTCCDYKVIGNRDWLKTKAIDVKKFYGNDVIFVSNYASCRNEEVVRLFDGRYINAFGDLPSKSSNRGYDAAMIFCELMFTGFEGFADKEFTPLVTTYKFMNNGKSYVNVHWMREHYRSNSSVDIE